MLTLGLDPGRHKMGWAFADRDGELLVSGICLAAEREKFLTVLAERSESWIHGLSPWLTECTSKAELCVEPLTLIAVGNGTGSSETVSLFKRLGIRLAVTDESGTTLEARGLYWLLHSPAWWQRCLPRVLWFPPRPLDDLAAWAIVRRCLGIQ